MQSESKHPRFSSVATVANSTQTAALAAATGKCNILCLPEIILGRTWPEERVLMGFRVCKQLRSNLLEHARSVVLVAGKGATHMSAVDLAKALCRLSHLTVALRWQGPANRLAEALRTYTTRAHLDLSGNGIGYHEMEKLAGVLGECKALVHLKLSGNEVGVVRLDLNDNGIDFYGKLPGVLGECKTLAHLDLSSKKRGIFARIFAGAIGRLAGCKALVHLDLSGNGIGTEGVNELVKVLRECKALAHLNLSGNRIGAEGVERLVEVLRECKALAHLNLSGNGIGAEGVERLVEVLRECKALAHLNVGKAQRSNESANRLSGVLEGGNALAHLDLSGIGIRARGAGSLADVLRECKRLVHLDLSHNFIHAGAGRLTEVIGECKALVHFDLSGNEIGVEGAKLVGVLSECKALAHLNLSGNWIRDEGAGSLADVMGGWKALAYLNLSGNLIGARGAWRVAGVLGKCNALAHLDLSLNPLFTLKWIETERVRRGVGVLSLNSLVNDENEVGGIEAWLDWIKQHAGPAALEEMGCGALQNLAGNEEKRLKIAAAGDIEVVLYGTTLKWIDTEGAGRLFGVLGECKTLAHLNLRKTGLGKKEAERLAEVLGVGCARLALLNLSGNEMHYEEAVCLVRALCECQTLAHLDLSDNYIFGEKAEKLARELREWTAAELNLRL